MAIHSSILASEITWTRSLAGYNPWGHKELDTISSQVATSVFYRQHLVSIDDSCLFSLYFDGFKMVIFAMPADTVLLSEYEPSFLSTLSFIHIYPHEFLK